MNIKSSPQQSVRCGADVMSLPDFRLPALANITEIPTLRADGSILSTPGYDPVSKLYYVPSRNLIVPKIP